MDDTRKSRDSGPSPYFTAERSWALSKVTAMCVTSVEVLAEAGVATAPVPPASMLLIGAAGLGLAGCLAYSLPVLLGNDRSVNEASNLMPYTGPGLFLAPIGATLGGQKGMNFAVASGNFAVSSLQMFKSISEYGPSYLRGTHPEKILFAEHLLYLNETYEEFSEAHEEQAAKEKAGAEEKQYLEILDQVYDPHETVSTPDPVFEPNQGYDLNTLNPPGMGDVGGPSKGTASA